MFQSTAEDPHPRPSPHEPPRAPPRARRVSGRPRPAAGAGATSQRMGARGAARGDERGPLPPRRLRPVPRRWGSSARMCDMRCSTSWPSGRARRTSRPP